MKQNLISGLKIAIGVVLIGLSIHAVNAVFVPGSSTPSSSLPERFLDVSADPQAKQGWLAIGTSSSPLATLDVLGTTVTDTLGVVGDAWISGKMRVGGILPPAVSDPSLVVDGGRIRSSALAGTGDRPVCSDANGLLKICGTASPVGGTCGPNGMGAMSIIPENPPTTSTPGLCAPGETVAGLTLRVGGGTYWEWTCSNGTPGTSPVSCSGTVLPPGDLCTNLAGVQSSLPTSVSGVTYTDPDGDRTCSPLTFTIPVTSSPTNCYIYASGTAGTHQVMTCNPVSYSGAALLSYKIQEYNPDDTSPVWRDWATITYPSAAAFPLDSGVPRIQIDSDGTASGATMVPASGRTCTGSGPSRFDTCAFRIRVAPTTGAMPITYPRDYSLAIVAFSPTFSGGAVTTTVSGSNTVFTWPKPDNDHVVDANAFIRKEISRCGPSGFGGSTVCSTIAETRNATSVTVPTSSIPAGSFYKIQLFNTFDSPNGRMTDEL